MARFRFLGGLILRSAEGKHLVRHPGVGAGRVRVFRGLRNFDPVFGQRAFERRVRQIVLELHPLVGARNDVQKIHDLRLAPLVDPREIRSLASITFSDGCRGREIPRRHVATFDRVGQM